MYSHICVGSDDLAKAKTFYDAVFEPLGATPIMADIEGGRVAYSNKGANFMICRPINGESASYANGGTIGFAVDSTEQADAWHKAGIEAGGKAIEDPPGWREGGGMKLYLAYLRDPDGNKICTMLRG